MENEFLRKQEDINEVLAGYALNLQKEGYYVLGIFLYGSQNYNMDTPNSDIDAYAVVLPDAYTFAFQKTINTVYGYGTGNVKVKDLRVFVSELLKGNYSTLELLLTPYKVLAPYQVKDGPVFHGLLYTDLTERILTYDLSKTIKGILGSALEMKRHLWRSDRKRQLKDLARLMHLYRLSEILMSFFEGGRSARIEQIKPVYRLALAGVENYGDTKIHPMIQKARDLKSKDPDTVDEKEINERIKEIETMDSRIRKRYETWLSEAGQIDNAKQKDETEEWLAEWVKDVFATYLSFM